MHVVIQRVALQQGHFESPLLSFGDPPTGWMVPAEARQTEAGVVRMVYPDRG